MQKTYKTSGDVYKYQDYEQTDNKNLEDNIQVQTYLGTT